MNLQGKCDPKLRAVITLAHHPTHPPTHPPTHTHTTTTPAPRHPDPSHSLTRTPRRFGFVELPQHLSRAEATTLRAEFDNTLDLAYSHRPFTGEERHWSMVLGPSAPLFAKLPEDARFCGVAEQACGAEAFLLALGVNRMASTATDWHAECAPAPSHSFSNRPVVS